MKQKEKKGKPKPRNKVYDNKLGITGSFLDVIKAAAKNANDNSLKKEEKK